MFAGVDGCRGGWCAAVIRDGCRIDLYPDIRSLWSGLGDATRILIDIPIGLSPDAKRRECDAGARKILGKRSSSVFPVPIRDAVRAASYAGANRINRERTGLGVSRQAYNIFPKIREVDALLIGDPAAGEVILESHPEVCFRALGGAPMEHYKKTAPGINERLELLREHLPEAGELLDGTRECYPRSLVGTDDILDAMVLAVSAARQRLATLPATPERDGKGLPMRIMYPLIL